MSQLKQAVKNNLELKSVGPQILASVDTLIQRALLRLMKNDILPPRVWEFTCSDYKNEKKELEYFILPEDFRAHDEFYVYDDKPYFWTDSVHKLRDNKSSKKLFTVLNENFDQKDKGQKWLVASPFPDDDKTVRIKYYSDGSGTNWDWITQEYWEVIITEIESILQLTAPERADEERAKAIGGWKRQKGSSSKQTRSRLKSSYFGGINYK